MRMQDFRGRPCCGLLVELWATYFSANTTNSLRDATKTQLSNKISVPNAYAAAGRGIIKQFTAVVLLTEQKRVPSNSRWAQILSRARFGVWNEEDILFMKGLVLTNPACLTPDFQESGWLSAVLVTSRNAVRIQWNAETIRKWCATNRKALFRIPCCDEIRRDKRSPTKTNSALSWRAKRNKPAIFHPCWKWQRECQ